MSTDWIYDERSRRYRDTTTGLFVKPERAHELRDAFVDRRRENMTSFVDRTMTGLDPRVDYRAYMDGVDTLRAQGWRRIENTFVTEYMYGRGGINAMTPLDREALQPMLDKQRSYWMNFTSELNYDPRSPEYIANRANLYTEASRAFHERGKAAAWDAELPTYPGEQKCGSRCKCHWEIKESDEEVRAYWELGVADHCEQCVINSDTYYPFLIRTTAMMREWELRDFDENDAEYEEHKRALSRSSEWTVEEREAWKKYINNDYQEINGYLRGKPGYDAESRPEAARRAEVMRDSMTRQRTGGDMTVYRGDRQKAVSDRFADVQPGSVVHDRGFVSTAYTKDAPESFGYNDYPLRGNTSYSWDIRVPRGTNYMPADAAGGNEMELVFPPGSSFRVTKVERIQDNKYSGTRVFIEADLIPGGVAMSPSRWEEWNDPENTEVTQPRQCKRCAHWRGDGTCNAFEYGIPIRILMNEHDHREPYPGDGGIRYTPKVVRDAK